MPVALGLDCGGTTSRAVALDDSGAIVWRAQAGPCNVASTPEPLQEANLAALLAGSPTPSAVCGCFAGLLTPDDRERAMSLLRTHFPSAEMRIEPDYVAALYAAPPTTDVVVIAGTGSLICSRSNGSIVKSGGGGFLLGDSGSGFKYGLASLRSYLSDPSGATTFLTQEIERIFGDTDPALVIARTYRPSPAVSRIAALLRAYVEDLKTGSPYAITAAHEETEQLACGVLNHIRRYHANRPTLAISLAGGVWKSSSTLRQYFAQALQAGEPAVRFSIIKLAKPPVEGAAILARQLRP